MTGPTLAHASRPPLASTQQPMGIVTTFSVSAGFLRRRWAILLAVVFIVVGPASLVVLLTGLDYDAAYVSVYGDGTFPAAISNLFATQAEFDRLAGAEVIHAASSLFETVLTSLSELAVAVIVAADYAGRRPERGPALRTLARKSGHGLLVLLAIGLALAGVGIVALILWQVEPIVGAMVGVVLAAYVLVQWALAVPILALDDLGARAALSRSRSLTSGNMWRTFATLLVGAIIEFLLTLLLGLAVEVVAGPFLEPPVAGWVTSTLVFLLVLPVWPVLLAVLYFDLRVRHGENAGGPGQAPVGAVTG